MNFAVSYEPFLPITWLLVLGLLGFALVAVAALARARGWWLRAISLALLLASLTNPTFRQEEREPLKDNAVTVV